MIFIPAQLNDARFLLAIRNDPLTIAMSTSEGSVSWETHLHWLAESINCNERDLYVAHDNNVAVGSIRCDHRSNFTELSWTVAPAYRGRGTGKLMLKEFTEFRQADYVAKIRHDNIASIRVCIAAGFVQFGDQDGLLYFRKS